MIEPTWRVKFYDRRTSELPVWEWVTRAASEHGAVVIALSMRKTTEAKTFTCIEVNPFEADAH